ncbi:unnamed protein product [Sympodiomycopsis kandeliae]
MASRSVLSKSVTSTSSSSAIASSSKASAPSCSSSSWAVLRSSSSRWYSSSRSSMQEQQQQPQEGLSRPRRDPNLAVKSEQEIESDSTLAIPTTEWDSNLYKNPAPPTEISQLIPPLSGLPLKKNGHNIGVGPGGTSRSSIRLAERALHLYMQPNGHHIGPRKMFRGVNYGRLKTVPDVRAPQHHQRSSEITTVGKQAYMESVGGDYSRYVPRSRVQDYHDWQSTADHALASNPTIPPQSRSAFHNKVADILAGRVELVKPLDRPVKEKEVPHWQKPKK